MGSLLKTSNPAAYIFLFCNALISASSSTVEPLDVFITIACFCNKLIAAAFKIFFVSGVAGVCIDKKSQSGIIELIVS